MLMVQPYLHLNDSGVSVFDLTQPTDEEGPRAWADTMGNLITGDQVQELFCVCLCDCGCESESETNNLSSNVQTIKKSLQTQQVLSKMMEALSSATEISASNNNRWTSSGGIGQEEEGGGYDDQEYDDEDSIETCSIGTMEDATTNAFNVRIKVFYPPTRTNNHCRNQTSK